ncbi:MAG: cytochrome c biogenesis protein CcsA [Deferribacteraceae bacterium]|jgi:heme exporter protein C|nr:cytochrome c biogenesis protein CcsA [Deferribacteraceae bacterium]
MLKSKLFFVIDVLAIVMIPVALWFAFFYAPLELRMGAIQKIFYFHVASAWVGFAALFVTFVCSIIFLIKRNHFSDDLAAASAGIGLLFCTVVLMTGPLWARPTWGVWWTWDPRLTTTLILWFIYAGYVFLRKFIDDPDKRGKYCAVLGIIGFFDVPIVFLSIRFWRTIHPNVVQSGGGGLHPDMRTAMFVALGAFTLLYISLANKRVRLAKLEREYYTAE